MRETRLRVAGNGMRVTDRYAPSWARLVPKPLGAYEEPPATPVGYFLGIQF